VDERGVGGLWQGLAEPSGSSRDAVGYHVGHKLRLVAVGVPERDEQPGPAFLEIAESFHRPFGINQPYTSEMEDKAHIQGGDGPEKGDDCLVGLWFGKTQTWPGGEYLF